MKKKVVKPKKMYVRSVDKSEAEKVLNSVKKKGKKVVEVSVKSKRGRPKKSDSLKGIDKQTLEDISYAPKRGRPKKKAEESWESPYPDTKCFYTGVKNPRPKKPKVSVKKKSVKVKGKVTAKLKPKKMSDKHKELNSQRKVQEDIFYSILEHVDCNENFMLLDSDWLNMFAVIVKSVELKVNRVNNQSIFQPYETNDVNKYCLVNIVSVGDELVPAGISGIDSLLHMGCPVHTINRIEDVARVLDGIGNK